MDGVTTTPGFERVDIKDDRSGCQTVWRNTDEAAPSVVPKLSLANGLVYTYTKPQDPNGTDAWYFTALDFRTGSDGLQEAGGHRPRLQQQLRAGQPRPGRHRLRGRARRPRDAARPLSAARPRSFSSQVISKIGEGLSNAFLMAYEVWWALVLGFAISAVVQAWVPRERVERSLSGEGIGAVSKATALGAASSSCSYAAIAIAKSLFQKGASAVAALAFQFASTNLVWELGLVLWILLGWQFALAEYVGGIVMIGLMWMLRPHVHLEAARRAGAPPRPAGRRRPPAPRRRVERGLARAADVGRPPGRTSRTTSAATGRCCGRRSPLGFLIAGFIALLGEDFFNFLFVSDAPQAVRTIENVVAGPLIAVLSFVCSIGNVPLAAVLWSGGISFAGVLAFIFADLIVLPIIARVPQVLRHGVRAPDHRADVRRDGDRGAGRRRALRRRRADPERAAGAGDDVRLDRARLQAGAERGRARRLRRRSCT